ncbi:6315_t:CDS:2 [Entrophospora sp. SA101]|nr:6315_t:CDS:2 [Entrophospora sp. SA101]
MSEQNSNKKNYLEHLPPEILQEIFILAGNPLLVLVSRMFYYDLSHSPQTNIIKTKWLLYKFDFDYKKSLYRGLRWKFFNKHILNQLDQMYSQSQSKLIEKGVEIVKAIDDNINSLILQESEKKYNDIIGSIGAQTLILPMLAPQTTSPIPSSSTTDSEILELVEILLKRGASPNDPNSYPLTKSCQINNLDMVKLLLKYKADPTIISLQIAIKYNNEPLINLLIESGIKIDNKLITFAESKASVFPQTIELLKTLQLKQLKN